MKQPESQSQIPKQEYPRILLIDLENDVLQMLRSSGFNTFSGSLGTPVKAQYDPSYAPRCRFLPDVGLPSNLHEFEIFVVNMLPDAEPIPYDPDKHTHSEIKTNQAYYYLTEPPTTVFDPRPISGSWISQAIDEDFVDRPFILVAFGSLEETLHYQPSIGGSFNKSNYSFLPSYNQGNNRVGKDTKVTFPPSTITNLLNKYNSQFRYSRTFVHLTVRQSNSYEYIDDPNFCPLIQSHDDQIVSFLQAYKKGLIFVFPQLENKADFLTEFFRDILPSAKPELFPYSNRFLWLEEPKYYLPNQQELHDARQIAEEEYQRKLEDINNRIAQNKGQYKFLHDLLTETDTALVQAVITLLEYLGFEQVINADEVTTNQKEEDIQIHDRGRVLVAEVKGIHGTSTDSDCSQISKIRRRREKHYKRHDVHGLYIVNHQRGLPPHERKNPPFQQQQITDAESDDRGLLSTFQLFNLYFAIEADIISKEDARNSIFQTGLVSFKPTGCKNLGSPSELAHGNTVGRFELNDMHVYVGQSVILEDDERFSRAEIISIQQTRSDLQEVSSGETGIKFSSPIKRTTVVWLPS